MEVLRRQGLRLLVWVLAAVVLLAPGSLQPGGLLLGDPRIDVWNHAWGYWYVAEALGRGELPWRTELVGGPDGGVLYFIDTPGALALLPVTWLLGPAVAYNLALVGRVALTGLAGQLLCEELDRPGLHTWVAGLAMASTPFLLGELRNGISEVCATQWLVFTLWAAARAVRTGRVRDWLLVGLLQGLTSVVTFYYGLASALGVATLGLVALVARLRRDRERVAELFRALVAVVPALVLVVPHWLAFRASLAAPDALIRREGRLELQLMAHNAVDPRVFVMPGDFQSVDLAGIYGEPFVHTGYLRWSVILLVLLAFAAVPRVRRWLPVLLVGLVAALGPYLWWGGDWVRVGGHVLSLPFEWIRRLLPQVAITHPLRLGLTAQAVAAALAGVGAGVVARRFGRPALAVVGGLILGEALVASAATWPIPTSPAAVPEVYADAPPGMVLDLPAEVGTTMETSAYFWYQTVHQRPIPYTTDVRLGSTRDPTTFTAFRAPPSPGQTFAKEGPTAISGQVAAHVREHYGLVVLHTELAERAGLSGAYEQALTPHLGEPEVGEGVLVWRPGAAR